jgi:hypothetical protein
MYGRDRDIANEYGYDADGPKGYSTVWMPNAEAASHGFGVDLPQLAGAHWLMLVRESDGAVVASWDEGRWWTKDEGAEFERQLVDEFTLLAQSREEADEAIRARRAEDAERRRAEYAVWKSDREKSFLERRRERIEAQRIEREEAEARATLAAQTHVAIQKRPKMEQAPRCIACNKRPQTHGQHCKQCHGWRKGS